MLPSSSSVWLGLSRCDGAQRIEATSAFDGPGLFPFIRALAGSSTKGRRRLRRPFGLSLGASAPVSAGVGQTPGDGALDSPARALDNNSEFGQFLGHEHGHRTPLLVGTNCA
jgi:hypothetical protein